ncbi:MAG: chemoreceptor glutamine deamidase CheD [Pseudomonadota bacterium]|nr:chemoreceptor glutamine deamidase CheD [Pseudomonadota bacterium]
MSEAIFSGTAHTAYYDRHFRTRAIKLLPGEYQVAGHGTMLVTVLGSCVAACIRDTRLGIGGMNHFMLPEGSDPCGIATESARYGAYAMEVLVNDLLKHGADRRRLEAKVFGGGGVAEPQAADHGTDTKVPKRAPSATRLRPAPQVWRSVGERNATFVLDFLHSEGIRVAARDLLEVHARKVYYFPHTGRTLVKKLRTLHNDTILERERAYRVRLLAHPVEGHVELFG